MEFQFSEQKLSNDEVQAFEKKYNLTLPQSYKILILENNGGFPSKEYFRGKSICFESIKYGEYPIEKSFEMLKDVLPKGFLPFGQDGGGWLFCFDLNVGENYGKIYFFQSDGEYYLLVNSFEEFMNELTDDADV